jgi:hypothetical protein
MTPPYAYLVLSLALFGAWLLLATLRRDIRREMVFATLYCRPDLWRKMLASGVLFFLLYFVVFVLFDQAFPGYVAAVWDLKAVSGILLWGVPLEELLFAFTFGLYWSRHVRASRLAPNPPARRDRRRSGTGAAREDRGAIPVMGIRPANAREGRR